MRATFYERLGSDQQAVKTHLKSKTAYKYTEGEPVESFKLDVEVKLKRGWKAARGIGLWEAIYTLLFLGEIHSSCKQLALEI
jgi:hypothetical protein